MTQFTRRHMLALTGAAATALAMPNIARASARRLRLAHNNTTTSGIHAGAEAFAKAVEQLSGGSLAIDIFPSAQLGNESQTTKAIVDGTLDALVTNIGPAADYLKDISLIELPYLFKDAASARAAFDGALGAYATESLKPKGIFVAGWGENGMRHITANKAIRTPADVKDLKIRVQISVPTLETFLAMGAKAEVLPFNQLVEALRTGRFEAQENPAGIAVSSNLNKVQSHMSLTGHIYAPLVFALSNDVYEEMSATDKALIVKAGAAGVKAQRDFADNAEKAGIAALKSAGMTIVEDIDRAAFKDAAAAVRGKMIEIYGADSLKRVTGFSAA